MFIHLQKLIFLIYFNKEKSSLPGDIFDELVSIILKVWQEGKIDHKYCVNM